jgi:aspartate carbamoyltransferase catalytic subunit
MKAKQIRHFITQDDFTTGEIKDILNTTRILNDIQSTNTLQDKLIVTLFFENSTRTRSSFEIAAKRLGAKVVNLDLGTSSSSKGESIEDTIANLNAMKPDVIVIRHRTCGLPKSLTRYVNCPIINAGDGKNSHPTQALLDLYTIHEHFDGDIDGKSIAIVGDIKNSRVASSNLKLLPRFGIKPILVAPDCFMPTNSKFQQASRLADVIDQVDIVMSLRTQLERHTQNHYETLQQYAQDYCITKDIFGDRDILLLHPGPVNRNIDISDDMLVDSRCKVLRQVTNGVAVRMAILLKLLKS